MKTNTAIVKESKHTFCRTGLRTVLLATVLAALTGPAGATVPTPPYEVFHEGFADPDSLADYNLENPPGAGQSAMAVGIQAESLVMDYVTGFGVATASRRTAVNFMDTSLLGDLRFETANPADPRSLGNLVWVNGVSSSSHVSFGLQMDENRAYIFVSDGISSNSVSSPFQVDRDLTYRLSLEVRFPNIIRGYVNGNLVASLDFDLGNFPVRMNPGVSANSHQSLRVRHDNLDVWAWNLPPTAEAGSPQTVQLGSTAHLDGSGSRDDYHAAWDCVYAWNIENAPVGSTAALTGADTVTPSFVPDRIGTYTVKLTLTDGSGLQGEDETTVTVTPVINGGGFEDGFAGWTTAGNVAIDGPPFYSPADGTRLVTFNGGDMPANGVISQVLQTIPGQAYRLEFDAGVIAFNRNDQRLGVTVVGNSRLVSDTVTLTGLGGGRTLWVPKSYQFISDSAATTLTFSDLSPVTNAIDLLLDHVRVTAVVKTLLVTSSPGYIYGGSVDVAVTPQDTLGAAGGVTSFRRFYNPGTMVNLTAPDVVGDYMTFFNWLKDGEHFSTEPAIQVSMDMDHQMTAVYWGGEPMITVQPASVLPFLGEAVTFRVTASGAAPLSYQWRFNGTDIPGATNREFAIDHAVPGDVGNYDVVITNSLGTVTSNEVTLAIQPDFAGLENGSFEAEFQGWTVSGNVAIGGPPFYVATDGRLLAAFNGGNKPVGGVLSQTFATTPGQSYILSFDLGVIAYNTSEQRLLVTVSGNGTLFSRAFLINGLGGGKTRWLAQTENFIADSDRTTLFFRDFSPTSNAIDLLLDRVRIVPPIIRTLNVEANSVVGVSPADLNGDADASGSFSRVYMQGAEVTLSVPAFLPVRKFPPFEFQKWLIDGVEYSTSPVIHVTMDADHTMTAVYVILPPVIDLQPADVVTGVGGSALFFVNPFYDYYMAYQWRFNGIDIPGATSAFLWIYNVSLDDAGSYDLVISNDSGTITSNPAELTVVSHSLVNGGFESGFDMWTASGNVAVESGPFYVPAGGWKIAAFNAGDSPPNGVLSQTFATTPGITYLLSFDMGVIAFNTNEQRLRAELTGGTDSSFSHSETYSIRGPGAGRTQWITKQLGFTAASTATTVTFRDVSAITSAVDLLLDNVRLDSAPEGFSLVPAGAFQMGSPVGESGHRDNEIQHLVSINQSFFLKKTEVTWAEWNAVRDLAAIHGYTDIGSGQNGTVGDASGNHPVTAITWWDAVKWCNLKSEIEKRTPVYHTAIDFGTDNVLRIGMPAVYPDWSADGYRLPTEAEWEYACRAGTNTAFFTGPCTDLNGVDPNLEPAGWYYKNSADTTHPVAQKQPNPWGLSDTHGNVNEWCWDWHAAYPGGPQTDPRGGGDGTNRVIRGGSWSVIPGQCRAAFRNDFFPTIAIDFIGFRPARNFSSDEFVTIPGGTFQMGDSFAEGDPGELPVHGVFVRAFYMAKHEVTKALWDEVTTWGAAHGYVDLPDGGAKADNHPVYGINWYAMVKWCNARSEKEGLTPCYTVSSAVYRTGDHDAPDCDWNANGYRLPSEAEWEKAARGGLSGKRFPWGDIINHSFANYFNGHFSYESPQNHRFHPDYDDGNSPCIAPVGSFAANGYGLHDMAGNVWERCWDWLGAYPSDSLTDPHGPASGSYRVFRGGSWTYDAGSCRAARRVYIPSFTYGFFGFRVARSSVP